MSEEEMKALVRKLEENLLAYRAGIVAGEEALMNEIDNLQDEIERVESQYRTLVIELEAKHVELNELRAGPSEFRSDAIDAWRQIGGLLDVDDVPDEDSEEEEPEEEEPSEETLGVVREVPIFNNGEFTFGGAIVRRGGTMEVVPFEGEQVLQVVPSRYASGGVSYGNTNPHQFVKAMVYKLNAQDGAFHIRSGSGWATIELDTSNAQHWFVNGVQGTSYRDIPVGEWVELAIDLTNLGVNVLSALEFYSTSNGAGVYLSNVGFDTTLETVLKPLPEAPEEPEEPPPPPEDVTLTRFSTSPVTRWDYSGIYHPIEGAQPGKMPDGWSFEFDHVVPNAEGELVHRVTNNKCAGIKWEREKSLNKTQGHYITEATFGRIHDGIISAPLWLFSEGTFDNGHEFDFELTQGGVEYNLHNGRGGYNMKRTEKDLSGHRARFEIIRRPDHVTMRVTSLTDGWTDSLVITPDLVAQWARRTGAPQRLVFPPNNVPMFPLTEHWVSRFPNWSGTWRTLPEGQSVDMILHGYAFLP